MLLRRVRKRSNRPLLRTADPEATLRRLLEERSPTYALADMTIESRDGPHDAVVDAIMAVCAGALARVELGRAGGAGVARGRRSRSARAPTRS